MLATATKPTLIILSMGLLLLRLQAERYAQDFKIWISMNANLQK